MAPGVKCRMILRLLTGLALLLGVTPAEAAQQFSDIACETTATGGTGTVNLAGAASGGYLTFIGAGIVSGASVPYIIVTGSGVTRKIETGIGTFTDASPDTLTRVADLSTDGSGTELTLSNPSTVCIGPIRALFPQGGTATSWNPTADATADLGTTALSWNNIYLDTGATINFENGDVLITMSANDLAFSGVTGDYSFDDTVGVTGDVTASADVSSGDDVIVGDDIQLGEGGVINWDNGDCTITQTGNALAVAGCVYSALVGNVETEVITGDSTYTVPANLIYAVVYSTGGGGGGGGADGDGSSGGGGSGGGSGGTCIERFTKAQIGSSVTVDIGGGGAGGLGPNGAAGTAGSDTTFGSLHTANGGAGGAGTGVATGAVRAFAQNSASCTGGTVALPGGSGMFGYGNTGGVLGVGVGGNGAGSIWGEGGPGDVSVIAGCQAGQPSDTYGGGGGGGSHLDDTTGCAGGAGGNGLVVIYEYLTD
jgi:hypothetical protein